MKNFINRFVIAATLVTMLGVVAVAKIQHQKITLATDTMVNGTLLKEGTYDVRFNDETGEISILKGSKVVAKATAKLEKRDAKARETKLNSVINGKTAELVKLTFAGFDHDLVLAGTNGSTTGN
jgi:hypothetical protein